MIIIAFITSLIINKTFRPSLQNGEILSMQLVQTDVDGNVSPGDTIDVVPIIYNDDRIQDTALNDGSPAYS